MVTIKKIAETTERVALFYFPVILMCLAGLGIGFVSLADTVSAIVAKVILIIIGVLLLGFAFFLSIMILNELSKSIEEDKRKEKGLPEIKNHPKAPKMDKPKSK